MNSAPNRHWFKFSLRTLLVAVALFAGWMAYEVHWIHQRHAVLTNGRFTTESPAGSPVALKAPGLLWLFGEPGYESLWLTVPKGDQRDDMELSPSEKAEIERVSRLFPEAEMGEWWGYELIVPAPPPATTVRESEHNPVDELDPFRRGPFKGGMDLIR